MSKAVSEVRSIFEGHLTNVQLRFINVDEVSKLQMMFEMPPMSVKVLSSNVKRCSEVRTIFEGHRTNVQLHFINVDEVSKPQMIFEMPPMSVKVLSNNVKSCF